VIGALARGVGQVNGIPTPTLDAFLDVVKHIGDKSPARVKTVSGWSACGGVLLLPRGDYAKFPPRGEKREGYIWRGIG